MSLNLKSKNECEWDFISLGEVLLRFDPENERIHNARNFRVFDGGGEYNVTKNLSKCFRRTTAIATSLANNALGRLAQDFIKQGGIDDSMILWRENARNGLYFIERGFGLRAPSSVFDRENTATSSLKTGEIDWQTIFGEKGARWFLTGGVFTGLSETTPGVALEAMKTAQKNGTVVSYDLNYRGSLWKNRGGMEAANALNRRLLPHTDVVFGVFGFDSKLSHYDENAFRSAAEKMMSDFPNIKLVVSSLREVHSASRHDLSGACFDGEKVYKAQDYKNIEIFDRIGSGDAFAAGFIYGLLDEKGEDFAINCAAAHGALAMTTAGDNSASTLEEVLSLMKGEGAHVKR